MNKTTHQPIVLTERAHKIIFWTAFILALIAPTFERGI